LPKSDEKKDAKDAKPLPKDGKSGKDLYDVKKDPTIKITDFSRPIVVSSLMVNSFLT
jgi:hypothetical protein